MTCGPCPASPSRNEPQGKRMQPSRRSRPIQAFVSLAAFLAGHFGLAFRSLTPGPPRALRALASARARCNASEGGGNGGGKSPIGDLTAADRQEPRLSDDG